MATDQAAVTQVPMAAALIGARSFARPLLVVAGVLLLTVSAKLQIPLWPVPMTMQTYVILIIGMAYGTGLGLVTIGCYLAAGALGLPVFAGTPEKGIGLAYMAGPTGGYLVGFLLATFLLGRMAERGWDRRLFTSLVAITVAHVLILTCGAAWLAVLVGWERAIAVGVAPFVVATIVKTILAGVTLPLAWRWVHRLS
jgi:biotin transport system substrate-specific component